MASFGLINYKNEVDIIYLHTVYTAGNGVRAAVEQQRAVSDI